MDCPKCGKSYEPNPDRPDRGCPHCLALSEVNAVAETMQLPALARKKASSDSSLRLPPVKTFAHYEIIDEIGRGAYGVVYKALDPELRRVVAVKVLLAAEHASAEEVERFYREASSAAKLQHPNIVPIHEFKSFEGKPYYTMDYVEGHPLDEIIAAKTLNVRQSLELVEKLAGALNHAHSRGIIHRDLKPGNIMVSRDGEPKIADFGLAKVLEETEERSGSSPLTRSGVAMGTPQYMAPEQATGQNRELDGRADIYALGCILYELLTGSPPFTDANSMEVLRAHVERDPTPPSHRGAKVADDVETICLKCLEKEPDRRYRTAGALAEDIRRFLDGEPIAARRASVSYVLRRKIVRHKTLAAVVAASVALLLGSSTWYILKLRQEHALMERALYRANLGLAHEQALRGYAVRADSLLADCPSTMRNWEWGFVKRVAHQELISLAGHSETVNAVAASSDGRWLASAGEDRTVRLWEADSGRSVLVLPGPAAFRSVALDPKGRRLAAGTTDGQLLTWTLSDGLLRPKASETSDSASPGAAKPGCAEPGVSAQEAGRPERNVKAHSGAVLALAFDPQGRWLASAGEDKTASLRSAETGDLLRTMTEHSKPVTAVAFDPDGGTLATGSMDNTVCLWNPETGAKTMTIRAATLGVTCLAFNLDGTRLAAGEMADVVGIWDTRSGLAVGMLKGHISQISSVQFSPDGTRLASGCVDGTVKVWDSASCRELLMLRGHTDAVWAVAFLSDGRRLASASSDRTVKVWDSRGDRSFLATPEAAGFVRSLVFSPDGKLVASGHADGEIQILEADTGRRLLAFPGHAKSVRSALFTPDGGRLVTSSSDGTIRSWDSRTGAQLGSLPGPKDAEAILAVSPDGARLAVGGSDPRISILSLPDGREAGSWPGHEGGVFALAFSPDGKWLASGGAKDRRIVVRDASSGRERTVIRSLEGNVYALAFSRDGRQLASTIGEGSFKIWDASSGRELHNLIGHQGQARAMALSPDGARLATGGSDRSVKLWDAEAGRLLLNIEGHAGKIYALAFSPDGRRLASGGRDKTVRIWLADEWQKP